MIHHKLKEKATHIEAREISYNYEFKQDTLFGGKFLERINRRMHRVLGSCASDDPDDIELDKFDFSDMLTQVERRDYNAKVPSWITKLIKQREQKSSPSNDYSHRGGGGGGGDGGGDGDSKRCSFNDRNDSDRAVRVVSSAPRDTCKLCANEVYIELFHPGNTVASQRPRRRMKKTVAFAITQQVFSLKTINSVTEYWMLKKQQSMQYS